VSTALSAVVGLALGVVLGVLVDRVFAPAVKALKRRRA
jgi:hypothetical protein